MKQLTFTLFFVLFLVACGTQSDGENELTPPIAPTPTSLPAVTPAIAAANTLPPPPTNELQPTVPPELLASPTPGEPEPTATPAPTSTPLLPDQQAFTVRLDLVVEGFESPVAMAHTTDDRLFILEQPGRIRIVQNGQILPEPFLNIQCF